jgi:hypothetical protein
MLMDKLRRRFKLQRTMHRERSSRISGSGDLPSSRCTPAAIAGVDLSRLLWVRCAVSAGRVQASVEYNSRFPKSASETRPARRRAWRVTKQKAHQV